MQVGGFFQNPSLNPYMNGNFEAAAISLPDQIAQLNSSSMPTLTDIEQTNSFNKSQNRKNALSGKGGGNSAAFGVLQQGFGMANNYLNKDLVNSEGFDTFNKVADGVVSTLSAINPAWGAIAGAVQTGINGINAAGATKSDSFSIDAQTQQQVGGSYIGSYDDMTKASQKAGKKYGLFNRKGFKQAQKDIAKSQQMQNTIQDVNQDNQSRLAMAANIQMNAMNYANKLNGGIDFNNMRIGRLGFKLENLNRCHKIKTTHVVNINTKRIEEFKPVIPESTKLFKEGGSIEKEWKPLFIYQEIPQMKNREETKQEKSRTIEELIEYAKQQNPRFIQRMSEPVKYLDLGNGEKGTHMLGWATDDKGNAIVYSQIQENDKGDLFDYGDSALDRAIKNKNYLIMTPEEAKLFTESGKDSEGNLFGYKKGWSEFFLQEFKQGGPIKESDELVKLEETNQKNVIPDGALHKNKHHIEHTEEYTQKGIPVVDNDGEQQAEVELNEIIFTLEVTKKLEELHKIYKEGSKSDQDKAAIEAGKLLVQEILYNTIDRTGLISKCENGGKL